MSPLDRLLTSVGPADGPLADCAPPTLVGELVRHGHWTFEGAHSLLEGAETGRRRARLAAALVPHSEGEQRAELLTHATMLAGVPEWDPFTWPRLFPELEDAEREFVFEALAEVEDLHRLKLLGRWMTPERWKDVWRALDLQPHGPIKLRSLADMIAAVPDALSDEDRVSKERALFSLMRSGDLDCQSVTGSVAEFMGRLEGNSRELLVGQAVRTVYMTRDNVGLVLRPLAAVLLDTHLEKAEKLLEHIPQSCQRVEVAARIAAPDPVARRAFLDAALEGASRMEAERAHATPADVAAYFALAEADADGRAAWEEKAWSLVAGFASGYDEDAFAYDKLDWSGLAQAAGSDRDRLADIVLSIEDDDERLEAMAAVTLAWRAA